VSRSGTVRPNVMAKTDDNSPPNSAAACAPISGSPQAAFFRDPFDSPRPFLPYTTPLAYAATSPVSRLLVFPGCTSKFMFCRLFTSTRTCAPS
jgi:hypothetical protein